MSVDLFTRIRHRLSKHGTVTNVEIIQRPLQGGYTLQFVFNKEGEAPKLFRKHAALIVEPKRLAKAMYQDMIDGGHIDIEPSLPTVTFDPLVE